MSLEPAHAPFRCWEHEDCLEHPALAIACAGGERTALAMFSVFVYPEALSDMTSDQVIGGWNGGGTGDGYGYEDDPLGDGSDGQQFPYSSDPSDWEQWLPTIGDVVFREGPWLGTLTDYERVLWYHLMLRTP